MKDFAPRFTTPVSAARPRGSRLLEAFSPKLGRRVSLFDRSRFDQWIRLEADPSVVSLCERPLRTDVAPHARLVDFWIRDQDGEHLLFVDDGELEALPAAVQGVDVRRIASAELAAASVWIANWKQMLPTINATLSALPATGSEVR